MTVPAPTEAGRRPSSRRPWIVFGFLAVLVLVLAGAGAAAWFLTRDDTIDPQVEQVAVARQSVASIRDAAPQPRTVAAYDGQGAWVDAFDYSPPYAGTTPPLAPAVVNDMAAHGVKTVYLQAGRLDARSPDLLEDRWLVGEFILRAHQAGLRVVGWYLPKWDDAGRDLDHLVAISQFSVLGHRFDGIAVDIEYTSDGLPLDERNARLVALSQALRARVGAGTALGAIVLPPVQTEVINPQYWPSFPWTDLKPLYDVWMPMSYWSFRTTRSGYKDGYRYTEESVRRLRANLASPSAPVHPIGGIGAADGVNDPPNPDEPLASINDLPDFVRALRDVNAVGGSLYDWRTTGPNARERFASLMSTLTPH
jgi:hypothetical protein